MIWCAPNHLVQLNELLRLFGAHTKKIELFGVDQIILCAPYNLLHIE